MTDWSLEQQSAPSKAAVVAHLKSRVEFWVNAEKVDKDLALRYLAQNAGPEVARTFFREAAAHHETALLYQEAVRLIESIP